MATFKVGQRVRIVGAGFKQEARFVGCEATIIAIPPLYGEPGDCSLLVDGFDGRQDGYSHPAWRARFSQLAPLTDPKADAFLESIRKLEREPNNTKLDTVAVDKLGKPIRV